MPDIVTELRIAALCLPQIGVPIALLNAAADEIERLRAVNAGLQGDGHIDAGPFRVYCAFADNCWRERINIGEPFVTIDEAVAAARKHAGADSLVVSSRRNGPEYYRIERAQQITSSAAAASKAPEPVNLDLFRDYVKRFDDDPVLNMAPDVIAELEWLRAENTRLHRVVASYKERDQHKAAAFNEAVRNVRETAAHTHRENDGQQ